MESILSALSHRLGGSLPPQVEGPIQGEVELCIPFVRWHRQLPGQGPTKVVFCWWGENKTSELNFFPAHLGPSQPARSFHPQKRTSVLYPVRAEPADLREYIQDMPKMKLALISKKFDSVLGHSTLDLADHVNLSSSCSVNAFLPIYKQEKKTKSRIGEIFVRLSVNYGEKSTILRALATSAAAASASSLERQGAKHGGPDYGEEIEEDRQDDDEGTPRKRRRPSSTQMQKDSLQPPPSPLQSKRQQPMLSSFQLNEALANADHSNTLPLYPEPQTNFYRLQNPVLNPLSEKPGGTGQEADPVANPKRRINFAVPESPAQELPAGRQNSRPFKEREELLPSQASVDSVRVPQTLFLARGQPPPGNEWSKERHFQSDPYSRAEEVNVQGRKLDTPAKVSHPEERHHSMVVPPPQPNHSEIGKETLPSAKFQSNAPLDKKDALLERARRLREAMVKATTSSNAKGPEDPQHRQTVVPLAQRENIVTSEMVRPNAKPPPPSSGNLYEKGSRLNSGFGVGMDLMLDGLLPYGDDAEEDRGLSEDYLNALLERAGPAPEQLEFAALTQMERAKMQALAASKFVRISFEKLVVYQRLTSPPRGSGWHLGCKVPPGFVCPPDQLPGLLWFPVVPLGLEANLNRPRVRYGRGTAKADLPVGETPLSAHALCGVDMNGRVVNDWIAGESITFLLADGAESAGGSRGRIIGRSNFSLRDLAISPDLHVVARLDLYGTKKQKQQSRQIQQAKAEERPIGCLTVALKLCQSGSEEEAPDVLARRPFVTNVQQPQPKEQFFNTDNQSMATNSFSGPSSTTFESDDGQNCIDATAKKGHAMVWPPLQMSIEVREIKELDVNPCLRRMGLDHQMKRDLASVSIRHSNVQYGYELTTPTRTCPKLSFEAKGVGTRSQQYFRFNHHVKFPVIITETNKEKIASTFQFFEIWGTFLKDGDEEDILIGLTKILLSKVNDYNTNNGQDKALQLCRGWYPVNDIPSGIIGKLFCTILLGSDEELKQWENKEHTTKRAPDSAGFLEVKSFGEDTSGMETTPSCSELLDGVPVGSPLPLATEVPDDKKKERDKVNHLDRKHFTFDAPTRKSPHSTMHQPLQDFQGSNASKQLDSEPNGVHDVGSEWDSDPEQTGDLPPPTYLDGPRQQPLSPIKKDMLDIKDEVQPLQSPKSSSLHPFDVGSEQESLETVLKDEDKDPKEKSHRDPSPSLHPGHKLSPSMKMSKNKRNDRRYDNSEDTLEGNNKDAAMQKPSPTETQNSNLNTGPSPKVTHVLEITTGDAMFSQEAPNSSRKTRPLGCYLRYQLADDSPSGVFFSAEQLPGESHQLWWDADSAVLNSQTRHSLRLPLGEPLVPYLTRLSEKGSGILFQVLCPDEGSGSLGEPAPCGEAFLEAEILEALCKKKSGTKMLQLPLVNFGTTEVELPNTIPMVLSYQIQPPLTGRRSQQGLIGPVSTQSSNSDTSELISHKTTYSEHLLPAKCIVCIFLRGIIGIQHFLLKGINEIEVDFEFYDIIKFRENSSTFDSMESAQQKFNLMQLFQRNTEMEWICKYPMQITKDFVKYLGTSSFRMRVTDSSTQASIGYIETPLRGLLGNIEGINGWMEFQHTGTLDGLAALNLSIYFDHRGAPPALPALGYSEEGKADLDAIVQEHQQQHPPEQGFGVTGVHHKESEEAKHGPGDTEEEGATVKLKVLIEKAIHLALDTDENTDSSACFVTFGLQNESHYYTSPISDIMRPVWDFHQKILLNKDDFCCGHDTTLIFKVWKRDFWEFEKGKMQQTAFEGLELGDMLIGKATVDLTPLLSGFDKISAWYHLVNEFQEEKGQIKVLVQPLGWPLGDETGIQDPVKNDILQNDAHDLEQSLQSDGFPEFDTERQSTGPDLSEIQKLVSSLDAVNSLLLRRLSEHGKDAPGKPSKKENQSELPVDFGNNLSIPIEDLSALPDLKRLKLDSPGLSKPEHNKYNGVDAVEALRLSELLENTSLDLDHEHIANITLPLNPDVEAGSQKNEIDGINDDFKIEGSNKGIDDFNDKNTKSQTSLNDNFETGHETQRLGSPEDEFNEKMKEINDVRQSVFGSLNLENSAPLNTDEVDKQKYFGTEVMGSSEGLCDLHSVFESVDLENATPKDGDIMSSQNSNDDRTESHSCLNMQETFNPKNQEINSNNDLKKAETPKENDHISEAYPQTPDRFTEAFQTEELLDFSEDGSDNENKNIQNPPVAVNKGAESEDEIIQVNDNISLKQEEAGNSPITVKKDTESEDEIIHVSDNKSSKQEEVENKDHPGSSVLSNHLRLSIEGNFTKEGGVPTRFQALIRQEPKQSDRPPSSTPKAEANSESLRDDQDVSRHDAATSPIALPSFKDNLKNAEGLAKAEGHHNNIYNLLRSKENWADNIQSLETDNGIPNSQLFESSSRPEVKIPDYKSILDEQKLFLQPTKNPRKLPKQREHENQSTLNVFKKNIALERNVLNTQKRSKSRFADKETARIARIMKGIWNVEENEETSTNESSLS